MIKIDQFTPIRRLGPFSIIGDGIVFVIIKEHEGIIDVCYGLNDAFRVCLKRFYDYVEVRNQTLFDVSTTKDKQK